MRIFAAFLLCVAVPATAAFSQECSIPEKTPFAEECSKRETQQGLNQCYREALDHSEQTLDEAYRTVVNRLQEMPDAVLALELAKESWKVHRDAECLFSASGNVGGSMYPMILDECKGRHNLAQECRLQKHFLNCKEGDPLCPVPPAR
jgi:uncharacterized protein YecT (DUF1311 family)